MQFIMSSKQHPGLCMALMYTCMLWLYTRLTNREQTYAMCSTGWITHFGEKMANTSAEELSSSLATVLRYGNGTGSVNLYMAHGGSNWGFWAGAPLAAYSCLQ